MTEKTYHYGKPKDYSLRRIERDGRFDGDMQACLDYVPGLRKPFRVRAWHWHTAINWNDDPNWGPRWYEAKKGIERGDFDYEKFFKNAWDAAIYVGKIRGYADAIAITQRMHEAREAGKTVLA